MSEKNVIKCSICGKEQVISTVEYIRIVEQDLLRICIPCRKKAVSIGLPLEIKRENHSELLVYIAKTRGVKDET